MAARFLGVVMRCRLRQGYAVDYSAGLHILHVSMAHGTRSRGKLRQRLSSGKGCCDTGNENMKGNRLA
jgi:hypothetical protein